MERLDNFRWVYVYDDDFPDKNEVVYACIYNKKTINEMFYFIKNTSGKDSHEILRYDPITNDYWLINNDGFSTLMRDRVLIWLPSQKKYFLYPVDNFKAYNRKIIDD